MFDIHTYIHVHCRRAFYFHRLTALHTREPRCGKRKRKSRVPLLRALRGKLMENKEKGYIYERALYCAYIVMCASSWWGGRRESPRAFAFYDAFKVYFTPASSARWILAAPWYYMCVPRVRGRGSTADIVKDNYIEPERVKFAARL